MSRVVFLIDGFNLYHALVGLKRYSQYRWLDLAKLCSLFTRTQDSLVAVYYFTALATWNRDKAARHKCYIRALESTRVHVVRGQFKRKDKTCPLCLKQYQTYEEKQTDVNIAIHLFRLAVEDRFDTAIIVSGDSDLIPALTAVRQAFPDKSVGVIIPIGRASESLKQTADFHMRMKENHLRSSLFPREVKLSASEVIACPAAWA